MTRRFPDRAAGNPCCASPQGFQQRGFTLLELMVALTVMAITMTVLLKAVSGQQDQARYQRTVERVGRIKDAIVKVSNVNGGPMLGGFVADLGRLPVNLHELLEPGYCASDITKPEADCVDWKESPPWHGETICQDATIIDAGHPECPLASPYTADSLQLRVSLNAGWNGPYVETFQHPSHVHGDQGSDALTDGWGNQGYNPPKGYPATKLKPDPRHQYGWYFSTVYKDGNGMDQPGVILYSHGNGCYLDPSLCKGNQATPDLLDFIYPLSASPLSQALVYDANGKAVTPDPVLSPMDNSLPPPPIINKDQWQVVIGDTTQDIGSGMGVNVTLAANSNYQCTGSATLTAGQCWKAELCDYPSATSESQCGQLGGGWVSDSGQSLCKGPTPPALPTEAQCVSAGISCTYGMAKSKTQCDALKGSWQVNNTQLCLNIYYVQKRKDVNGYLSVVSANGSILEDGGQHTVHFAFPMTAYPGSGISVTLPVGNAAFSVHESTGKCSSFFTDPKPPPPPNGTDMPTYPTHGRQAVPVKILPGQTPSFVW